jgi:hypothetical protein
MNELKYKIGNEVFVVSDNYGQNAVIINTRPNSGKPDSHYKVRTEDGQEFWAFDFEISDRVNE